MKLKYYAMAAVFLPFTAGDLLAEECPSADEFLAVLVSNDDSKDLKVGKKILGFEVLAYKGSYVFGLGEYAPENLQLLEKGAHLTESVQLFLPGKHPEDFKTYCAYKAEGKGKSSNLYVGKN